MTEKDEQFFCGDRSKEREIAIFIMKNEEDLGQYEQGEKWFIRDLKKLSEELGQPINTTGALQICDDNLQVWDYQAQDFKTVIVRTVHLRSNLIGPTEPPMSKEEEELEKELEPQPEVQKPIEKIQTEEPSTD